MYRDGLYSQYRNQRQTHQSFFRNPFAEERLARSKGSESGFAGKTQPMTPLPFGIEPISSQKPKSFLDYEYPTKKYASKESEKTLTLLELFGGVRPPPPSSSSPSRVYRSASSSFSLPKPVKKPIDYYKKPLDEIGLTEQEFTQTKNLLIERYTLGYSEIKSDNQMFVKIASDPSTEPVLNAYKQLYHHVVEIINQYKTLYELTTNIRVLTSTYSSTEKSKNLKEKEFLLAAQKAYIKDMTRLLKTYKEDLTLDIKNARKTCLNEYERLKKRMESLQTKMKTHLIILQQKKAHGEGVMEKIAAFISSIGEIHAHVDNLYVDLKKLKTTDSDKFLENPRKFFAAFPDQDNLKTAINDAEKVGRNYQNFLAALSEDLFIQNFKKVYLEGTIRTLKEAGKINNIENTSDIYLTAIKRLYDPFIQKATDIFNEYDQKQTNLLSFLEKVSPIYDDAKPLEDQIPRDTYELTLKNVKDVSEYLIALLAAASKVNEAKDALLTKLADLRKRCDVVKKAKPNHNCALPEADEINTSFEAFLTSLQTGDDALTPSKISEFRSLKNLTNLLEKTDYAISINNWFSQQYRLPFNLFEVDLIKNESKSSEDKTSDMKKAFDELVASIKQYKDIIDGKQEKMKAHLGKFTNQKLKALITAFKEIVNDVNTLFLKVKGNTDDSEDKYTSFSKEHVELRNKTDQFLADFYAEISNQGEGYTSSAVNADEDELISELTKDLPTIDYAALEKEKTKEITEWNKDLDRRKLEHQEAVELKRPDSNKIDIENQEFKSNIKRLEAQKSKKLDASKGKGKEPPADTSSKPKRPQYIKGLDQTRIDQINEVITPTYSEPFTKIFKDEKTRKKMTNSLWLNIIYDEYEKLSSLRKSTLNLYDEFVTVMNDKEKASSVRYKADRQSKSESLWEQLEALIHHLKNSNIDLWSTITEVRKSYTSMSEILHKLIDATKFIQQRTNLESNKTNNSLLQDKINNFDSYGEHKYTQKIYEGISTLNDKYSQYPFYDDEYLTNPVAFFRFFPAHEDDNNTRMRVVSNYEKMRQYMIEVMYEFLEKEIDRVTSMLTNFTKMNAISEISSFEIKQDLDNNIDRIKGKFAKIIRNLEDQKNSGTIDGFEVRHDKFLELITTTKSYIEKVQPLVEDIIKEPVWNDILNTFDSTSEIRTTYLKFVTESIAFLQKKDEKYEDYRSKLETIDKDILKHRQNSEDVYKERIAAVKKILSTTKSSSLSSASDEIEMTDKSTDKDKGKEEEQSEDDRKRAIEVIQYRKNLKTAKLRPFIEILEKIDKNTPTSTKMETPWMKVIHDGYKQLSKHAALEKVIYEMIYEEMVNQIKRTSQTEGKTQRSLVDFAEYTTSLEEYLENSVIILSGTIDLVKNMYKAVEKELKSLLKTTWNIRKYFKNILNKILSEENASRITKKIDSIQMSNMETVITQTYKGIYTTDAYTTSLYNEKEYLNDPVKYFEKFPSDTKEKSTRSGVTISYSQMRQYLIDTLYESLKITTGVIIARLTKVIEFSDNYKELKSKIEETRKSFTDDIYNVITKMKNPDNVNTIDEFKPLHAMFYKLITITNDSIAALNSKLPNDDQSQLTQNIKEFLKGSKLIQSFLTSLNDTTAFIAEVDKNYEYEVKIKKLDEGLEKHQTDVNKQYEAITAGLNIILSQVKSATELSSSSSEPASEKTDLLGEVSGERDISNDEQFASGKTSQETPAQPDIPEWQVAKSPQLPKETPTGEQPSLLADPDIPPEEITPQKEPGDKNPNIGTDKSSGNETSASTPEEPPTGDPSSSSDEPKLLSENKNENEQPVVKKENESRLENVDPKSSSSDSDKSAGSDETSLSDEPSGTPSSSSKSEQGSQESLDTPPSGDIDIKPEPKEGYPIKAKYEEVPDSQLGFEIIW